LILLKPCALSRSVAIYFFSGSFGSFFSSFFSETGVPTRVLSSFFDAGADTLVCVLTGGISSVLTTSIAAVLVTAPISRAPPSKPPALDERGASRPSSGAVSARGALGKGGLERGIGWKSSSSTAWVLRLALSPVG